MSEEKNQTANNPTESVRSGDTHQTFTLIEQANSAAERLEVANRQYQQILMDMEALEVRRKLGGVTDGRPQEKAKVEITPKEYARMVSKGIVPQ